MLLGYILNKKLKGKLLTNNLLKENLVDKRDITHFFIFL